jgi:uncharacterized membrane protein YdjX (TVP38/TMEM64 family)
MRFFQNHRRAVLLCVIVLLCILIPFGLFEEKILDWTNAFLHSRHSVWAIGLTLGGLLAADIVLPVPSSLVNTAAGALLGFGAGAMVAWMGQTLGCLIGYGMGSRVARKPAQHLVGEKEWTRLTPLMKRYGPWMLVICRAVPVLAEASIFAAGLFRIPLCTFALLTALSNLGLALGYAAIGAFALKTGAFLLAFLGALLVPMGAMLIAKQFAGEPAE